MLRAGEDPLGSSRPHGGAVGRGDVGEDGGAEEHRSGVVGPLVVIDPCTIYGIICAVVDVVVAVQQSNPRHPVVRLLRPVAVGAIARVSCETCGELEKAAVRDG